MNSRVKNIVGPILVLGIFLGGWQLFADTLSPLFFAPPSAVALALVTDSWTLFGGLWTFLYEFLLGLLFSVVLGLIIGLVIGLNKFMRYALEPFVNALNATPSIVFLPLVIVWFGLNAEARLFFVVISSLFPMIINVIYAIQYFDRGLLETARAFKLSGLQTLTKIILPGMVPYLTVGLKTTAARAIVNTVVAEFLLLQAGIGLLLTFYSTNLDAPQVFAILVMIALVATAANYSSSKLEDRVSRWKLQ